VSVTFQMEKLGGAELLHAELAPLLEAHYQELTLNKDVVKLDPDWDTYFALQKRFALAVYTARDAQRLVGYNAFFVSRHLHYRDLIVAVNDVFYLHPDYRRGAIPLRFLRYAERQLKERGAHKLAYHFKASNNFGPLLQRLGYEPEEGVAAKLL